LRGEKKDGICDFCFHKLKFYKGDKTAPALYKLITGLMDTLKSKGGGPGMDERFIIQLQGKNYVTYEGLLDEAHRMGLESIKVDVVQLPSEENNMTAVCRAVAKAGDKTFTDFGDASPASVGQNLVPHILRMASTRAKARALRDMTNIGITAIEELDLGEKESGQGSPEHYKGYDLHSSSASANISGEQPAPTKRQLQTINDLAKSLNIPVDTEKLNRKTAGDLIAHLLDEKYKRN
jgi:hypothetical protein